MSEAEEEPVSPPQDSPESVKSSCTSLHTAKSLLEEQEDEFTSPRGSTASPKHSPKGSPPQGSPKGRTLSLNRRRPRILPMASMDRPISPTMNVGAKRMSFDWFLQQPVSSASSPTKAADQSTMIHWDYIMRRIQQNSSDKTRETNRALQRTFSGSRGHHRSVSDNDWDFWTQVVSDYQGVAEQQPERLKDMLHKIPSSLRPVLWQIISNSRNPDLEAVYGELSKETEVPCAKTIEKDLARTSLVKNVDEQALFRILSAYSLFDPEVGYTQGMAFVAVPLLFDIPESDVFCLFVQLMKVYDFRSLYLPEMPGLHLKLYQFERLLEDRMDKVWTHLKRQGVQSSMYASQWFLTVFAYKFPLELVQRILDIVIAEGYEVVLRVAFALMQQNADAILALKFDQLLPFLKDNIFDRYAANPSDLVKDTAAVDIPPHLLATYELEHQELHRTEKERVEQMDALRASNTRLTIQTRTVEAELGRLSSEHVEIVNKMVELGLENARLVHDNEELELENRQLKASVEEDFIGVVKERDTLREVRARLEAQIEGLHVALAEAHTA